MRSVPAEHRTELVAPLVHFLQFAFDVLDVRSKGFDLLVHARLRSRDGVGKFGDVVRNLTDHSFERTERLEVIPEVFEFVVQRGRFLRVRRDEVLQVVQLRFEFVEGGIEFAQFVQPPGFYRKRPATDAPDGPVYLAGEYTAWSSIQGAIESGRAAARAVLDSE